MPRGIIDEVEAVEEKPLAGVIMGMNGLGYVFVLTALAAGIAWIVFVAKSKGSLGNKEAAGQEDVAYPLTTDVCFQATVVSCLFYFVVRHHFSNLHY